VLLPITSVQRLALCAVLAMSFTNVGCVATFDAPLVHPDFVARERSPRTFRLESLTAEMPMQQCAGPICVRGARARIERGIEETLAQMAHRVAADAPADFIARLELVYVDGTSGNRWNAAEMSIEWRFTLEDARTHQLVVRASHTETMTVPSASLFEVRFGMLEQEILARIGAAAAQSPLDDTATQRMR